MAKGANGTIQINTQTIKQREQFGGADGKFGVATDRLGTGSLFPLSPIATNDQPNMYQGTASGDAASLQTNATDLYDVYINVVDPALDEGMSGFGFDSVPRFNNPNAGKAFLNYRHPDNPFIDATGTFNSTLLTLGNGNTYNDVKAYIGHPDLAVGDVSNPTSGQATSPTSGLNIAPDGASYGHDTDEYRTQINDSSNPEYGQHSSNSLGEYFKENY